MAMGDGFVPPNIPPGAFIAWRRPARKAVETSFSEESPILGARRIARDRFARPVHFARVGAREYASRQADDYFRQALAALNPLPLERTQDLRALALTMVNRSK